MKRLQVPIRLYWQKRFEDLGFSFHSMDGLYWKEGVCYCFSCDEIDHIEEVTQELNAICMQAVQYVIDRDLFDKLRISEHGAQIVRKSWNRKDLSL